MPEEVEQPYTEYTRMSPKERQSTLVGLIETFPPFYLPKTPEEFEEMEQMAKEAGQVGEGRITDEESAQIWWRRRDQLYQNRKASEHKRIVFERIGSLLSFAQTTETFKKAFMYHLGTIYNGGLVGDFLNRDDVRFDLIHRKAYPYNLLRTLFDRGDPNSGGVFDPQRAKGIEQRCHKILREFHTFDSKKTLSEQLLNEIRRIKRSGVGWPLYRLLDLASGLAGHVEEVGRKVLKKPPVLGSSIKEDVHMVFSGFTATYMPYERRMFLNWQIEFARKYSEKL